MKRINDAPGWLVAMLTASLIGMNLLANKSIDLPFEWLALDCGIVLSWAAFLSMDLITIRCGPKACTKVSILAMAINLALTAMFAVSAVIPGAWGQEYVLGETATVALDSTFYSNVFVLFGSAVAYLAAAIVNAFINDAIGKKVSTKFTGYAARTYISTAIGQITDNLVFSLIVSHSLFGWTFMQCFACSIVGALVELLFEMVFSPFGYKIAARWKV